MNRILLPALCLFLSVATHAAGLPEHDPVSLLIIADEVNPHRLSDADLTQPEDLAPALGSKDSGLGLSSVTTVDSQCLDQALELLESDSPPDVVLYFAHRGATDCQGQDAQPRLTALISEGLAEGLGFVVLHHGLYVDFTNRGVKAPLLRLIGSEADSIEWNVTDGQHVINVATGHFITSNGLDYQDEMFFPGTDGVPPGTYPVFTNTPDELYEVIRTHSEDGEIRTPLFATDSGAPRLLGYVLERPGWRGRVITYQPGEYQPNALDNRNGRNFQVLVNALYYAVYGDGAAH